MDKRIIILAGVLAFAIALGIVLGIRLASQAMAVVLGVTVGVVAGVAVGVLAVIVILRTGYAQSGYPMIWDGQESGERPGAIMLTPEQADVLLKTLQSQQASPDAFPLATGRRREFTAVGGAELTDDEP